MTARAGQWIQVDPAQVVASTANASTGDVHVSPSPYDIPLALRVVEDDPQDPGYALEISYLGGSERTSSEHSTRDVELQVGERSGRLYRVIVSSSLAQKGARSRLASLVEAIERFRDDQRAKGAKTTNYELVDFIVRSEEGTIVAQLKESASVARSPGQANIETGPKPKRMFDESWPDWKR